MAHKAEVVNPKWDDPAEPYWIESKREYEEYRVMAIQVAEDHYDSDKGLTLILYVDSETGVVTTDVGLYEGSLR